MKFMKMFFVLGMITLFGCDTITDNLEDGVHYSITIHEVIKYPRASKLEVPFENEETGEKVWVNRNPFLGYSKIKDVKLIPIDEKPGYYKMELTLDNRGRLSWMSLSNGFYDKPLAMVVEGKIFKIFKIKERKSEQMGDTVVIDDAFGFVTGKMVEKYAAHNYESYHAR